MKTELDRLMAERSLDAIVVIIGHDYSPALDYLVGRIHVSRGVALKKQGNDPVIVASPMEVEEAAATGFTVYTDNDLGWSDLLEEAEGDMTQATVALWGRYLEQIDVSSGKVGLYGVGEFNYILELVTRLNAEYPQYEFVGEMAPTLFEVAAITKDKEELERLKSVGKRTGEVQQATWDYIGSHRAEGEIVVKPDGTPLTIGDIKRFVMRELLDRNLEDTGMIFAQGRDAGFPHSRGQADMPLKTGRTIVFDLFPRELMGGYHHDTTRTWCIDYASEEVQQIYDTVMESFDIAIEAYGLGKPAHIVQETVQDYFESKDHPTSRSEPGTEKGYVHSLGHGMGLKVHEYPRLSHISKNDEFEIGNVFTIEPGLYYPEMGYGVRIEDSFYVAEDGSLIDLTDFHKQLVLPLRG
jgi:Xaa-Pro aminopeptidase